jgi:hypothetical protein
MGIGRDRIQLLVRNARQIKRIVEATYPTLYFGDEVRDTKEECSSPKVRIGFNRSQGDVLTNLSLMAKGWLANGKVLLP